MLREGSPPPTCHLSYVLCHVSHVTRHMSNVFIYFLTFVYKNREASYWRVCYLWVRPRLVFKYLYGIFVCICMVRGYQRAHTKCFEGLVLRDLIKVLQYIL